MRYHQRDPQGQVVEPGDHHDAIDLLGKRLADLEVVGLLEPLDRRSAGPKCPLGGVGERSFADQQDADLDC
jgi:hypothetical protein